MSNKSNPFADRFSETNAETSSPRSANYTPPTREISGGSSLPEIREATEEKFENRGRTSSELKEQQNPTDFSVNLDGIDWYLTMVIIVLNAILLEIHRTGHSKYATLLTWVTNVHCDAGWHCKIRETLFVLAVAVVNVIVLVPIVNINVRTPQKASWRFWLLAAWASLILLNVTAALQLTDTVLNIPDERHHDWIAQLFLAIMVTILTLSLDYRFVWLYGVFSCLTCNPSSTMAAWNGLRPIEGLPQQQRTRLRDILNIRRLVDRSMYISERPDWRTAGRTTTFKFVKDAREGVQRYLRRRRLQEMRHLLSHRMTDQITDMPSEEVGQYLEEIMNSRPMMFFSVIYHKILACKDAISEEPGFFEYSSWMKAAICFTILILIYNCIRAMELIFALDAVWETGHDVVQQMNSGLDSMTSSLTTAQEAFQNITALTDQTRISATVRETYDNLTSEISTLDSSLSAFLPDGLEGAESYQRASAMLHLILIRVSLLVESANFDGKKVISAIVYADSFFRWLKYACIVGYPLGTSIGFYSLYQVMRQHKDMSMGLAREEQIRSKLVVCKAGREDEIRQNLLGLEEKYPIGGAVYFIGVLASTAIVQQHIFGMSATMGIAVILNIRHFDVLLDCGGTVVLIYVGIIVVNYLSSHVIGDHLLTQHGFKIRYPFAFFLFLAVFTIVHAVLGFFYALWRALLLFLTTIWVLNRLDISLFQTGKKLDNGHYSFMSMLLLTHIIRMENTARIQAGDPTTPLRHASRPPAFLSALAQQAMETTSN